MPVGVALKAKHMENRKEIRHDTTSSVLIYYLVTKLIFDENIPSHCDSNAKILSI
jgi:hypothetical protein